MEKITSASVISRAAVADSSQPKKRFDSLRKDTSQNVTCRARDLGAAGWLKGPSNNVSVFCGEGCQAMVRGHARQR